MIDEFLEIFRSEEYIITDINTLNAYDINFKVLNDDDLVKIREVVSNFNEAKDINDYEQNLLVAESSKFSNVNMLLTEVRTIISQDYKETYFEAINENWEFRYYLADSDTDIKDTLFIKNELRKEGAVVYPVLAIKKFKGDFYLWNLLE